MLKAPCEHLWADGQSERENVILITDAQEKQMPETFNFLELIGMWKNMTFRSTVKKCIVELIGNPGLKVYASLEFFFLLCPQIRCCDIMASSTVKLYSYCKTQDSTPCVWQKSILVKSNHQTQAYYPLNYPPINNQ